MQRATAVPSGIKEKLFFVGASTLLALTAYNLLVSAPVNIEPGIPTSPIAAPGPLEPEKLDARVSDVRFYLENGNLLGVKDPKTGVFADRGRANPFQPLDDGSSVALGGLNSGKGAKVAANPKAEMGPVEPPPDEPAPEPKEKAKKETKIWNPKDHPAQLDFSGVMSMNGKTYGLLKTKDGSSTIPVSVGDYLDDYKYTVTSIEKQAIYVVDDEQRTYIARDLTFDADSSAGAAAGGDDEEKPAAKKKDKGADAPAAAAAAPTPKPAGKGQNGGGGKTPRQRPMPPRGGRGGAGGG